MTSSKVPTRRTPACDGQVSVPNSLLTGSRLPPGLADLDLPPRQLHLWGELPPAPWVAVVGTRHPSEAGAKFCTALVRGLVEAGVTVASGGAKGVDACAHEAAVDVGGHTVVVAPSGFERPYPAEHRELFERVVRSRGAFVSEHESDAVARRHTFFRRNALLVACSVAVIVVQAPLRSGARNAALWARKLGRPLFAVPHAPWDAAGAGCIEELKLGAVPLSSAAQVVRTLSERGFVGCNEMLLPLGSARSGQLSLAAATGVATREHGATGGAATEPAGKEPASAGGDSVAPPASRAHGPAKRAPELDSPHARVDALLDRGPCTLDQLHVETGLSVAELRTLLAERALDGHVREREDGLYEMMA